MVKKGRLSKLEIHYIKTNPGMSNEELASELDRTVDSVSKVIRDTVVAEAPQEFDDEFVEGPDGLTEEDRRLLQQQENKPQANPADFVQPVDGSHLPTRNLGKNAGWVAMTPAESVRGDKIPQKFNVRKGNIGVRKAFKDKK